jgi:putative Mg2+ transporter-C (MgtC) family protein
MTDNLLYDFALKGFVAFVCGFLIGLERELKGKSAGLRTSVLICIGSALFTAIGHQVISESQVGDPTRVFAQIISGVGFLGAGVIIQSNGVIFGLTTASTIWITSAIGVAVGVGYYLTGIYSAVITVLTLVVLRVLEDKLLYRFNLITTHFNCEVVVAKDGTMSLNSLEQLLNENSLILVSTQIQTNDHIAYTLRYKGSCRNSTAFCEALSRKSEVKKVTHQKQ